MDNLPEEGKIHPASSDHSGQSGHAVLETAAERLKNWRALRLPWGVWVLGGGQGNTYHFCRGRSAARQTPQQAWGGLLGVWGGLGVCGQGSPV